MTTGRMARAAGRRVYLTAAVVALTLAPFNFAFAQGLQLGGRLGPAYTTFAGDGDADWKLGWTAGAFVGYPLGRALTAYAELSFARKGAGYDIGTTYSMDDFGNVLETTYEQDVRIDYLQLQVPWALWLATGGGLRPRVYAGPSLALQVGCQGSYETVLRLLSSTGDLIGSEVEKVSGACEDTADDIFVGAPYFTETRTIDFGILFGAGLDIPIGRGVLTADIRFDLGLTDIDEHDVSRKNRALSILLGYSGGAR